MMGFNKVYNSLQQLFPHIDARLLKAVAIEHGKDPDEAVSIVLEEIIPFFTQRSKPSSPPASSSEPSEVISASTHAHFVDGKSTKTESSSELQKEEILKNQNPPDLNDANDGKNETFYDSYDAEHGTANFIELNSDESADCVSENLAHEAIHDELALLTEKNEVNDVYVTVLEKPEMGRAHLSDEGEESGVKLSFDAYPYETLQGIEMSSYNVDDSVNGDIPLTSRGLTIGHSESRIQLVESPVMEDNNIENSEVMPSVEAGNGKMLNPKFGTEDSFLDSNMLQSSYQVDMVEMVENMISDARNNKTMFSAMEAVISLMKEVELKEKAVDQAKEEAASGGTDILIKVEELKEMIQHTKDANDMHAGEVYGEKAILSTELKELQSRIFWLADQRDKSLAILDEMRQALEVRISVAEDQIKRAELEKLEKEKDLQQLLAAQELSFEKVVQESNILKKQAEENAKLEKFLLERGSVMDTLQGEIAVICQDVKLLKEKFDEHIPFSKSLASSQTSCILASSHSSSSSLRNLKADQQQTTAEFFSLVSQEKTGEAAVGDDDDGQKGLDEDWEIFDGPNIFP